MALGLRPWALGHSPRFHPVFALLSLAPGGVCPASSVTRTAVRSYRTFSPLPRGPLARTTRRFVFCGTVPTLASGGRYPPPCPVEPGLSSMQVAPHSDRSAHSERGEVIIRAASVGCKSAAASYQPSAVSQRKVVAIEFVPGGDTSLGRCISSTSG